MSARGFQAGNLWCAGDAPMGERAVDFDKALMLVKMKGCPLRHVDVLMVPKADLAMWCDS